jgi:hypothetical protein
MSNDKCKVVNCKGYNTSMKGNCKLEDVDINKCIIRKEAKYFTNLRDLSDHLVKEKKLKERQQIIFEHYVKVRDGCSDNCFTCKAYAEDIGYGLCPLSHIIKMTDDQLKAYIEKVERGE